LGTPEEKMKKILTLSAALMLFASIAMAQGVGLYIGTDCNSAAPQTATTTCTSNSGTAVSTFGTCVIPNGVTKSAFVGSIAIVDVQTALATIPDWWRGDACRGSSFTLATDGGIGGSTCAATLWDTAAPAGNNIAAQFAPAGNTARERFALGAVLYPDQTYDLTGDGSTELAVFKFNVLKQKTTGTGSCAGCAQGACIVLNEIQLQGQNDASEADYVRMTQPIAGHNYIVFQSGAPTCAGSTPTQNRTWGAVKALYR